MQLTDQTIAAAGLSCRSCSGGAGFVERDGIVCRQHDSAVAVSRFDSRSVEDEDDQQQTKAALQVGGLVLKCSQHAGYCRLC